MSFLVSINKYVLNIMESYINEIDNDIASISLTSSHYNKLFFYKNYKINNLPKLKKITVVIIALILAFTPLYFLVSFFYFIFLLIIPVLFIKKINAKFKVCLITGSVSKYNFSLLDFDDESLDVLHYNELSLLKHLSYKDMLKAAAVWLFFNFRIMLNLSRFLPKISRSLRVHAVDSIKLCLFQRIVINSYKNGAYIYLDSHYERWNYIASKLAPSQHCIIQHGFVRDDIPFKYKFGGVQNIFVYDFSFIKIFNSYYDIKNLYLIKSKLKLISCVKKSQFTLMLASSPVSIEKELKFLDSFVNVTDFDIYVKLHPLHDYKHRFNSYTSLLFTVDYLDVDVLVTYNSFLGFEYQSLGKCVSWLKDDCSIEEHIRKIYCSFEKG